MIPPAAFDDSPCSRPTVLNEIGYGCANQQVENQYPTALPAPPRMPVSFSISMPAPSRRFYLAASNGVICKRPSTPPSLPPPGSAGLRKAA